MEGGFKQLFSMHAINLDEAKVPTEEIIDTPETKTEVNLSMVKTAMMRERNASKKVGRH